MRICFLLQTNLGCGNFTSLGFYFFPLAKNNKSYRITQITNTFKGFTVKQFTFKIKIEIKVLYYYTPQPLHEFSFLVTVPP